MQLYYYPLVVSCDVVERAANQSVVHVGVCFLTLDAFTSQTHSKTQLTQRIYLYDEFVNEINV